MRAARSRSNRPSSAPISRWLRGPPPAPVFRPRCALPGLAAASAPTGASGCGQIRKLQQQVALAGLGLGRLLVQPGDVVAEAAHLGFPGPRPVSPLARRMPISFDRRFRSAFNCCSCVSTERRTVSACRISSINAPASPPARGEAFLHKIWLFADEANIEHAATVAGPN